MRRFLTLSLLVVAACSQVAEAPAPAPQVVVAADPHSFARPAEAAVRHVHLDLTADFASQRLSGAATLTLARAPGARAVVLDTRNLDVGRVTDADGDALEFAFGESNPILGTPLTIQLPASGNTVVVHYATRPDAAAVQWLTPAQTAGGEHPYLFTQGQAILTRTWIPTQDSPGIRQTYSARIVVPRGLTAVMSAEMLSPEGEQTDHGTAFEFRMPHAIPPYLIALAIGDLEFRAIGPRTGVWSEPGVVDAAASEFADTEKMVAAAEALYGPYRWGRYDILVLPP